MSKTIEKEVSGYTYTEKGGEWAIDTDYIHGKIYISVPSDEEDLSTIKAFGQALVKAVEDMRKDMRRKAS